MKIYKIQQRIDTNAGEKWVDLRPNGFSDPYRFLRRDHAEILARQTDDPEMFRVVEFHGEPAS